MTSISLKHPIIINGATVGTLMLRRPKVRDLEAMEQGAKSDIAKSVTLIANLTEQTPDTIRELDAEDFRSISEVLAGFLGVEPGQLSGTG